MKKLLVAAIMVVLPFPAFAAIQNVKVSGDITTSWVGEYNYDLGETEGDVGGTPAQNALGLKNQNVFITQTRLRVDADLSDNVSTQVGLINERAWNAEGTGSTTGSPTGYDTNVQLYLATLTLREFLYSPLTLTIGRQTFNYGNGLIMGNGGPVNQGSGNLGVIDQDLTERTAYDGVTATLDYKPLTINMIYFKNSESLAAIEGTVDGEYSNQSSDVYGYNANYQLSDPWSTVVEQYMFARIDGAEVVSGGQPAIKGDTLFVPGLRASTNPTKELNLQGEVAWQAGRVEVTNPTGQANAGMQRGEDRDAMAAQFLATYTLPVLTKYKPSVSASYTYASGDKNGSVNYDSSHISSAKTETAWDEFNTIQGAGTIYRSLFNFSNENILALGGSVSPLEDVTAGVTWSDLWAVDPYGPQNPLAIYQPDSAGSVSLSPVTKHNAYDLGNETDVNLTYNYTEDVTFGLTFGWFVPGSVFSSVNRDTASQAIANVAVTF